MIAGTITDQDIAYRLIDYADELTAKARAIDAEAEASHARTSDER